MSRETRALEQAAEEASELRDELAAIAQGADYDERTAAAPDPELREQNALRSWCSTSRSPPNPDMCTRVG